MPAGHSLLNGGHIDWPLTMPENGACASVGQGRRLSLPGSCSPHTTPTTRLYDSRQLSMASLCPPESDDVEHTERCSDMGPCTSDGMPLSTPCSASGPDPRPPAAPKAAAPTMPIPTRRSSSSLPRQLLSQVLAGSPESAGAAAGAAALDTTQEQRGSLDSSTDWTPLLPGCSPPGLPTAGAQLRLLMETPSDASSGQQPARLPAAPSLQSWAGSMEAPASAPSLAASPLPAVPELPDFLAAQHPRNGAAGKEEHAAPASPAALGMVVQGTSGQSSPMLWPAAGSVVSAEAPVTAPASPDAQQHAEAPQGLTNPDAACSSPRKEAASVEPGEEVVQGGDNRLGSLPANFAGVRAAPSAELRCAAAGDAEADKLAPLEHDAFSQAENRLEVGRPSARLPFRQRMDSAVYHRSAYADGSAMPPDAAAHINCWAPQQKPATDAQAAACDPPTVTAADSPNRCEQPKPSAPRSSCETGSQHLRPDGEGDVSGRAAEAGQPGRREASSKGQCEAESSGKAHKGCCCQDQLGAGHAIKPGTSQVCAGH
jgi:hypothetical protein